MESHMRALRRLAALTALVATQARALETLGVVAVAPPPGPGSELVQVTLQLGAAVAERHAGLLGGPELRARMVGRGSGASLAELEHAAEGARAAYVNGDYEGSAGMLRGVVAELEQLPDGPDGFQLWTRAMLRLAQLELQLGRAEAARGVVERVVRAVPDVEVDRALYPARFAQQVEAARVSLRAVPARSLRVTASAPEVRVYVNGRDVGTAPVTVALAAGAYRVSGARGAARLPPAPVDLADGDQHLSLDFTVADGLRPALGPGLALAPVERGRAIVAAGAYLGLDAVLAVSFAEEAGLTLVVGSLFDVRRGMLRREGRVRLNHGSVPAGGAGALAEFLVTGEKGSALVETPGDDRLAIRPAPSAAEPGAVELRPAVSVTSAARSRAAGWVALGSGVAALGFAALAVVEAQSAGDRYDEARALRARGNLSVADVGLYNGYVLAGDAAARRATASWAGTGVSALAAGILGYIQHRRTGEIGPFRF